MTQATQAPQISKADSEYLEAFDKAFTKVTKGGDWVLPVVREDGSTVYALQINKTAEDKENISEIVKAYAQAGTEVFAYTGKGGKPVLLVDASKKLKAQRSSASVDSMVAEMVALGVDEALARQAIATAKAKAKAAKQ